MEQITFCHPSFPCWHLFCLPHQAEYRDDAQPDLCYWGCVRILGVRGKNQRKRGVDRASSIVWAVRFD